MFLLGSGSAVFSSGKRASNEAQERSPSGVQFKISVQHSRPRPRPFHTGGPSGGFLRSISVADPDLELRGKPGALYACLTWLFFLRVFFTQTKGDTGVPGQPPQDPPLVLYMNGANSIHLTDACFGMTISLDA